jgi:hypothetical protein
MSTNISRILRTFLGLFLAIYALNQFFHFFPTSYGDMPDDARAFIDAVAIYLPYLYVFEFIVGMALIFDFWTTILLIVIAPLSVAFMIFNFANQDMGETFPALIVAAVNLALIYDKRERYLPLFAN